MGKVKKANGKSKSFPEVLTLSEAAAFLRVRESELLRDALDGRIPSKRIGDEWRFSLRGLSNWLGQSSPPVYRTGPELLAHIQRVSAAAKFHESEEEIESFLAGLRSTREASPVGAK